MYLGHFRDRIYHTVRKLWGGTDEHGSVPGDGSSHCLGFNVERKISIHVTVTLPITAEINLGY